MRTNRLSLSFLAVVALCAPLLQAKPLKVLILAGKSNMEGHAESYTFPAIAKGPKTADLYKQMVDEIAGFVWFQGFNDLVGPYPGDPTKKSIKDYSEYSRLLACLIRDLRKDLNTPKMPFVTGVLGVGGETKGDGTEAFHAAMAAPGEMEEFKGTVANVYTHKFWPADIEAIKVKQSAATTELGKKNNILKMRAKKGEDVKEESAKLSAEIAAVVELALTADEKFLLKNGSSNQGFHYHGSAKFFAQAGKAFAEALVNEINAK